MHRTPDISSAYISAGSLHCIGWRSSMQDEHTSACTSSRYIVPYLLPGEEDIQPFSLQSSSLRVSSFPAVPCAGYRSYNLTCIRNRILIFAPPPKRGEECRLSYAPPLPPNRRGESMLADARTSPLQFEGLPDTPHLARSLRSLASGGALFPS